MKFRNIGFYLDGGTAPMPEGPAPEGGQDPMAVLMQGAQQAVESQDCNVAMQVCQMLLELAQGGGQAPAGGAPEEAAPAPAEGEPVYRRGGLLSRRING